MRGTLLLTLLLSFSGCGASATPPGGTGAQEGEGRDAGGGTGGRASDASGAGGAPATTDANTGTPLDAGPTADARTGGSGGAGTGGGGGTGGQGGTGGGAGSGGSGSAGKAVDVVVLTATELPGQIDVDAYAGELRKVLAALRGVSGVDLRMALVAPRAVMDATFEQALAGTLAAADAPRFRAFDLAMLPRIGLVAALAAGCAESESDFPPLSGSSTVGPRVCGQDLAAMLGVAVPSLEHDWLWTLEPLRGKLVDFLRPEARRLYVFVAAGGAALLQPAGFAAMLGAQKQAGKAVVAALAPTAAATASSGICSGVSPDKLYGEIAKGRGGVALDFCGASWSAHGAALADLLRSVAK
jgi:hypothetical protein